MAVIEKKVAGEKPEPSARAEPTNITDLMAALEASVSAARQDRKAVADVPAKAKPAKATGSTRAKKAEEKAEAPRQRRRKTA